MFRALHRCYIPFRARDALLGWHWKRMYCPSIARAFRPGPEFSGKDDKKIKFKKSVGEFGHVEQNGLRIQIIPKESFSEAMCIEEAKEPPPSSLTDLYLDKIDLSLILGFHPDDYPEMNKDVCSFLVKLRTLATINSPQSEACYEELYIDNMATDLMRAVKYDDGREFTMSPCTLGLSIGRHELEAIARKMGMRNDGIVWVMQENKRLEDYEYHKGDIQLACCMIAAYQENALPAYEIYPERMMGIKLKGSRVYFYSMTMTASYLTDLEEGTPNEDIEVLKYPSKKGLSITAPKERRQILDHLWNMRCYAAGLEKLKNY